jgi:hypothetical protein
MPAGGVGEVLITMRESAILILTGVEFVSDGLEESVAVTVTA